MTTHRVWCPAAMFEPPGPCGCGASWPPSPAAGQDALLPCPFCGGEQVRDSWIRDGRQLGCRLCGASVHAFEPNASSKCVEKWNARAIGTIAALSRPPAGAEPSPRANCSPTWWSDPAIAPPSETQTPSPEPRFPNENEWVALMAEYGVTDRVTFGCGYRSGFLAAHPSPDVRDAERYRRIRRKYDEFTDHDLWKVLTDPDVSEDEFDRAIDTAIAKEKL